jgi:hypothetical protein
MKKDKCQKDSRARETSGDRKCFWCGKSCGIIKEYIIADDLENPRSYHSECVLMIEILSELEVRDLIIQKFKKLFKRSVKKN